MRFVAEAEDAEEPLSERQANVKQVRNSMKAPSSYSKAVGENSWTDPKVRMKLGPIMKHHRPSLALGTPVPLMDEILARVAEDCEAIQPTDRDCRFAETVSTTMSEAFPSEHERMVAMQQLLQDEYGYPFVRAVTTRGMTDGTVRHTSGGAVANMEVKNEVGSGGGSIHVQNASYAAGMATEAACDDVRARCRCPTLLIELAGPNMSLSGAVFGKEALCDPLTPMVSLLWLPHSPLMLQAARCFAAIRRALRDLDAFYSSLSAVQQPPPEDQLSYPYPCSYTDTSGADVAFQYTGTLSQLVFTATAAGQEIVVKFTRGYSFGAHAAMHAAGFAPALLGSRQLPGGWQVVAMEHVADACHWDAAMRKPAARLQAAVQALAAAGFVHGDLREPNVLVTGAGEESDVSVIDFGWAGTAGVARYPHFMSRNVLWPEGAADGEPITAAHDSWQVNRLLQMQ